MRTLWNSLLDLVFPPRRECPFCGAAAVDAAACANCLNVLRGYRREARCRVCGRLPKSTASFRRERAFLCDDCHSFGRPFVEALAPGPYEGILKDTVHRLKYGGQRHLSVPLAALMTEQLMKTHFFKSGLDLLLPVPLSDNKLLRRGFNQAALLAKEISEKTGIPLNERVLVKNVDTPSQTELPKAVRQVNLCGAFNVMDKSMLLAKKLLVIDDVFTTGSTVSAAATAIKLAGAAQVFVVTATTARCN